MLEGISLKLRKDFMVMRVIMTKTVVAWTTSLFIRL